jgi:hypothetical protein
LEIADYASARLLQRSPETDLRSAIMEAEQAFAAADAGVVEPLISSPASIYLPAGLGWLRRERNRRRDPDRQGAHLRAKSSSQRCVCGSLCAKGLSSLDYLARRVANGMGTIRLDEIAVVSLAERKSLRVWPSSRRRFRTALS